MTDLDLFNGFGKENALLLLNYTRLIYLYAVILKGKLSSYNLINTVSNADKDLEELYIEHNFEAKNAIDREVDIDSVGRLADKETIKRKALKGYIDKIAKTGHSTSELEDLLHKAGYDIDEKVMKALQLDGFLDEDFKPEAVDDDNWAKPKSENSPLNVYVFEEHHEALPYWFEAAEKGLIPKSGNTLLHIDGHSDMYMPFLIPGYPFFKRPRKDQIRTLMQRNDAFIQSAVMAGLITRIIWVWPLWDKENHDTDYESFLMTIGWTIANSSASEEPNVFLCECYTVLRHTECHFLNHDHETVSVDPDKCTFKRTVQFEIVSELKAVEFIKEDTWIFETDKVILDIDEDFYGCSYAIKPLLDANVTMKQVEAIDDNLNAMICPETTVHETQTNKIFQQVVALIRLQKLCRTENLDNCSKNSLKLKPELLLHKLLTSALDRDETKLCTDDENQTVDYQDLAAKFMQEVSVLTAGQLSKIEEIGFCSSTTPKALHMFYPFKFGLCYGANTPGESMITEYNPHSRDILRRSLVLKVIIKNLKCCRPKIVSICRSVRDGFTPRKYFTKIEKDILTVLNDTFKMTNVHYDIDLLGGKDGRPIGWKRKLDVKNM